MPRHLSDDKTVGCRVEYITTVDRPDLRGPSYPKVPPGHKIPDQRVFSRCKSAVQLFESILHGEYDFSSEYVSSAKVDLLWERRSPSAWRKRVVRRHRGDAWGSDRRDASLEGVRNMKRCRCPL